MDKLAPQDLAADGWLGFDSRCERLAGMLGKVPSP